MLLSDGEHLFALLHQPFERSVRHRAKATTIEEWHVWARHRLRSASLTANSLVSASPLIAARFGRIEEAVGSSPITSTTPDTARTAGASVVWGTRKNGSM